jgi:hypothetical protein
MLMMMAEVVVCFRLDPAKFEHTLVGPTHLITCD